MNNKSSLTLLFFVFLSAFVQGRTLARETLYMLNYSQRNSTKLVDISYELNLPVGQTAEVSFSFSNDDGATFPVRCVSVTGHVGPGQTSGGKMVVWDAGVDWPMQFTDRGRIQATCVIEDTGPPIGNPIVFDVAEITFKASNIEESPSWFIKEFYSTAPSFIGIPGTPKKYFADKFEVTNFQWNEVVDWARNKGYDLQPVSYASGGENLPRTNVAMKEVVKWLNARSEMEGKMPVFYVDPMEGGWDENGDGKLSAGPDSMWPSPEEDMQMMNGTFDWSLIANPGNGKQEGWIQWDPNHNGQWDPGEPFVDRNRNGRFEPQEFDDINGNGRRDTNLTIVCRTGDISGWFPNYAHTNASMNMMGGWHIDMHVKQAANGYRLPMGLSWGWGRDDFRFLAMGGRTEQGSYQSWEDWMNPETMDPITGEWKQPMKTGIRYEEEWPWGKESPENKADIDEYAITPYGFSPASGIQPVGGRKPNGYGLHDMIGNVAELSMEWWINSDPTMAHLGSNPIMCNALGGSFKRLRGVDNFMMGPPPQNWDGAMYPGSVMSSGQSVDAMGSPEVGFRAIRVQF